jgi:hypothetical protein
MKKALVIVIFLLLNVAAVESQTQVNPYERIDKQLLGKNDSLNSIPALASYINRTFATEYERARAIFYWITRNISYAPELMYSFTTNESNVRLVKDVFENKTAVCSGYAALFDTLCRLNNINSYVVLGSTRQSFLPSVVGHAWNAVKVYDEWQLIDATWGSGYLQGEHFVKKPNDSYFLADPRKLISTHLPIDPIWQILPKPVTLYQFHSHLKSTVTTDWNYADSISVFLNSESLDQIKDVARRLETFGNNSEVTSNYFRFLKAKELEYYNVKLGAAIKNYNRGVDEYNNYVNFKNHQFTPVKSDEEIKKIIPDVLTHLYEAERDYSLVISRITDINYIENINTNLKQLKELRNTATEEKKFVDKYLATKKNKRRDLFYVKVYSPFGIPVK